MEFSEAVDGYRIDSVMNDAKKLGSLVMSGRRDTYQRWLVQLPAEGETAVLFDFSSDGPPELSQNVLSALSGGLPSKLSPLHMRTRVEPRLGDDDVVWYAEIILATQSQAKAVMLRLYRMLQAAEGASERSVSCGCR